MSKKYNQNPQPTKIITPHLETRQNAEKIVGDSQFFRYEIIAALLSSKCIELRLNRKLNPAEINFLRFVDRLTEGTQFEVSADAQHVSMAPGVIIGGTFSHPCVPERGVGYWIEAACLLCPFAKNPSEISFVSCVTNCSGDIGFDLLRTVTVPLLRKFGIESALQLKKRCCVPRDSTCDVADGAVIFTADNVRFLQELQPVAAGFIKRVRGVAFGVHVAPDLCNQTATSAKGSLLKILPDVYILTDIDNKRAPSDESVPNAGYGLCLITESTTRGAVSCAEEVAAHQESPEDLASRCVNKLFRDIQLGGVIGEKHQALSTFLMGIANDLPSQAHFGGELSQAAQYVTQHLMPNLFHVKFMQRSVTSEAGSAYVEMTCIGSRLVNAFKKSS